MGLRLSRWYEKPSTRDTLEKIELEIQNIEERRWDKIKREQFLVQIFSFIPLTVLIANLCILLYPSDSTWRDKLLLSVPIALINLMLWACKKVIQWYSHWSLDNEEVRLRKLQAEKRRILNMVCETESYRVATELLEKYDPKQLRRRDHASSRPTSPMNTTLSKISASPIKSPQQKSHPSQAQSATANQLSTSALNQSISFPVLQPPIATPAAPPPTPLNKGVAKPHINLNSTNPLNTSIAHVATSSVQGRPVRPIISKDRTIFEKVVDWLVADGPDNRFALICRFCYGHNGMSLAEEYETINFRCCYCYNLNTATSKKGQVHDQLQPEREKASSAVKSDTIDESEEAQDKTIAKEETKSEDGNDSSVGEKKQESEFTSPTST